MALNTVVCALKLILAKIASPRHIASPPPSFAPGPSFVVTYLHNGYFFSWACCLAKTRFNGAWAPLAADGALASGVEELVFEGIGGMTIDGAFLHFLCPLVPALVEWDIVLLVWWLSLQSTQPNPSMDFSTLPKPSTPLHLQKKPLWDLWICANEKKERKFCFKEGSIVFFTCCVSCFWDTPWQCLDMRV